MTRLSVNVNKIATLRNARGGSVPNVAQAATRIQQFGAQGITVHPRPDERHITYADVRELREVVTTEFNVEGYPSASFLELVLEARPERSRSYPTLQVHSLRITAGMSPGTATCSKNPFMHSNRQGCG